MATRKLLIAVFSRRTLATHSLTGKASPAFLSKPAKLCLYPEKVADIVMTVTDNCYVRENLIRLPLTWLLAVTIITMSVTFSGSRRSLAGLDRKAGEALPVSECVAHVLQAKGDNNSWGFQNKADVHDS
ncbi:Protein insensitive [Eumeta japonica]|uniref:Protein insensitive n=1 Tax=Eumeta variegata TaxID=151549 RepID=A0A4C2AD82_EUMVA|nr:Protein insensitive [Eumeta japonica]